ncbi:Piwi-domain-containing protein [Schizophyllum commune H4-8]|uniref:Uncharacterized protein n=1 Tax=Schizophyllum commune (strain H4-8 / FGSC 9210) TaxID=578458 RepID=D8PQ22_SCHCM|nr:Piwi-domain-containing protein [Schizophyllum commune H4-8]KAI5893541.1 Piwi-domain-containing protein [Schizophyllum commune H4-8]
MSGRGAGRGRGRGRVDPSSMSLVGQRGRGAGPTRGGFTSTASRGAAPVQIAEHVTTIGVKRPNFGTAGTQIQIKANSFEATLPDKIIHHYDVVMKPSEKTTPERFTREMIKTLQQDVAPNVFTPKAVYDGRKNLYAARELPFPEGVLSYEYRFVCGNNEGHPPKEVSVRLTKVAEINPESARRFIAGKQSHDSDVQTTLTAANVIIRMEPSQKFPFNVRSFYSNVGSQNIGRGIELWRGTFQSFRPGIGRCFINLDISTAAMVQRGSLIDLCLAIIGQKDPRCLSPGILPHRERQRLKQSLVNTRITVPSAGASGPQKRMHTITGLTSLSASELIFAMKDVDGKTIKTTVAKYCEMKGRKLRFPKNICVEVRSKAFIPLELAEVPAGQIRRQQIPADKTDDIVRFATKKPAERFAEIERGHANMNYTLSEYCRAFGVEVKQEFVQAYGRVLPPPVLKFGTGSKASTTHTPGKGSWNYIDRKLKEPCGIQCWGVVNYDPRFIGRIDKLVSDIVQGGHLLGMTITPRPAFKDTLNGQANIVEGLDEVVKKCGKQPTILIVVLPEGGNDIYIAMKHWGDILRGIPTQALKSRKCWGAKEQYYSNVCLKINAKLGGVNVMLEPRSIPTLADPHFPTLLIGADSIHPPPGADGRPSFSAVVGNIDASATKFRAVMGVQPSRQETIVEFAEKVKGNLKAFMENGENVEKRPKASVAPKRLIYYRDGVSEGQFSAVLEQELPQLKQACAALNVQAKITVVIVAKRHHHRFLPVNPKDAGDGLGNCPAGTVIDSVIAHPTEFDFYLQSHAGLLGTSRPAHYSVLYDENNFTADSIQSLSYALCHVYARSTRTVSVPAPVFYADIVCSRAKTHYDPEESDKSGSESGVGSGSQNASEVLEAFRKNFKPLHKNQENRMYFM